MTLRLSFFCCTALLLLILFQHCTKNPFFKDNKITPKQTHTIGGRVTLSDGANPENIFVWLEGVGLSTTTDASGYFTLQLHEPNEAPDPTLSGAFWLYYYLGNYSLDSSIVVVYEGTFLFGQGDVGHRGWIEGRKTLHKLLGISFALHEVNPTSLQPGATIEDPLPGTEQHPTVLVGLITLESCVENVDVEFYGEDPGRLTGYYLRRAEEPVDPAPIPRGTLKKVRFSTRGETRAFYTDVFALNRVGDYEFIPYINVLQEGLPRGLIAAIIGGERYTWADYAKIPFKRDNMYFGIINRKIEGSVTLSDAAQPDEVHVWFESMNIAVSTNFNGNFEMMIPPRSAQPGGGLEGAYELYFYLGNYALGRALVHFENGGTDPGSSVAVTLEKMLDIRMTVADSSAARGDSLDLVLQVNAVAAPVDIELFLGDDNALNGVFILTEDSLVHVVHDPAYAAPTATQLLDSEIYALRWRVPETLSSGARYRVVPFVFMSQDNLPAFLLDYFGPFASWLHPDYLRIPFKREDAFFVVE